jgi:hypothetical protein
LICCVAAPSAWKVSMVAGSAGVRIFSPRRSSGVWIGRRELVMCRMPLSQ